MGLRALLGYIPIVGDILAGLDTAAKFISNDEDDVSGLIKKGAKAISSSKQQETYRVKPADNPKGTAVTSGRLSFSERDRKVSIPGMSNPYIRSLYQFYDLNAMIKRDVYNHKADISTPSPSPLSGGAKGPTKRLG
jgi:hypothetical protein